MFRLFSHERLAIYLLFALGMAAAWLVCRLLGIEFLPPDEVPY